MDSSLENKDCENINEENGLGAEEKKVDTSESVSAGKQKLRSWLNKTLKIEMTDGRVVNGNFVCTDRDGNVILGSCCEYLKPEKLDRGLAGDHNGVHNSKMIY